MSLLFSVIIRQLRISRHITQKELAQAVFISPGAISQYEKGKCMPSRETLDHLAKYFGVSVDYLLGTSENAELEKLLTEEYIPGLKYTALVNLCTQVPPENRNALLTILKALAKEGGSGKPGK